MGIQLRRINKKLIPNVQIKGMNNELLRYKVQEYVNPPFTEKMVDKIQHIFEQVEELSEKKSPLAKVQEVPLTLEAVGCAVAGVIAESVETKKKKKALMNALYCNDNEIAIDINELITKKEKNLSIRYYGDSLRYSAQIKKEWLDSITLIYGDAYLQALDDMSHVSKLRQVWGDLIFDQRDTSQVDLSPLTIEMVYGDIHAERALSTAGLENLIAVSGTIFFQNQEYKNLEEFQEMIQKEKVKKVKEEKIKSL